MSYFIRKFGSNFNLLRPSDAIWRHRSCSPLAQVLACCLAAPRHYLNQCMDLSINFFVALTSKGRVNSIVNMCSKLLTHLLGSRSSSASKSFIWYWPTLALHIQSKCTYSNLANIKEVCVSTSYVTTMLFVSRIFFVTYKTYFGPI